MNDSRGCANQEDPMSFAEQSLRKFSEELSSREPIPGGGGASALVAALSISLGAMVGSLTAGKKKYASVEPQMQEWMKEACLIREELLQLIDQDGEAFQPLSEAYRIPKDDPGRGIILETALRNAAVSPVRILQISCRVAELLKAFAENGSVLAVSDAATGAAFCKAAARGAWINILANTRLMKDRSYALDLEEEMQRILEECEAEADRAYETAMERLSK